MTREEAIAILEVSKHMATSGRMYNQAIDMAIESLKAEPTDTDLISRADAMAEFREWVKRANENGETPTWNDAVSLIGSLPSAEAEHDGCDGCRYEHNTEHEYPCSECKQNHVDMWEQKPNDFIEVVRCKDCKYSFYDKDYESYNCRKHEYVELFDADDYCSWGERND